MHFQQKKTKQLFLCYTQHFYCLTFIIVPTNAHIYSKAGLDKPRGFQEFESPRFQDNRHMKVVGLSALHTGRLYPAGNIPGTHLCQRLSRPQGQSAAGRIMSMKNSNDTIGNRTRDLPACSSVPQPTAPPRTPSYLQYKIILNLKKKSTNSCIRYNQNVQKIAMLCDSIYKHQLTHNQTK